MTQQPATQPSRSYLRLVDRYASYFDRPELRLKFLSRTLAKQTERQERWHQRFGRIAFVERTRLYRWLLDLQFFRTIFVEFKLLLPSAIGEQYSMWREAPWSARFYFHLYQARHLLYLVFIGIAIGSLAGAVALGRQATDLIRRSVVRTDRPASLKAQPEASLTYLPGYRSDRVWMVENTAGYERYSNGARIQTTHETTNHARLYSLFSHNLSEAASVEVQRQPIGIVYHSSESDMLPFVADNSDSIRSLAEGLREYVRRHRSYNYLIDRFGEIHRIVKDEHAANHAGHSVWADDKYLYVGLNESFLGICFESTSATGTLDEQLTEAQLISGRALTAILRSKYHISDANCTTHGLVSIDPARLTIAHHHDWVRNFPFAAFNLSDKYVEPPASVSLYGFGTDNEVMSKLGGQTWPGAVSAEIAFRQTAKGEGLSVEDSRKRRATIYRAQMDKERLLRQQTVAEAVAGGER